MINRRCLPLLALLLLIPLMGSRLGRQALASPARLHACGLAANCGIEVTDAISGARDPWTTADSNAIEYNEGTSAGCGPSSSCPAFYAGHTGMGSSAEQTVTADGTGRMVLQGSHGGGSGSITLADRGAGKSTSIALAANTSAQAFDSQTHADLSGCTLAGHTLTLEVYPDASGLLHTTGDFAIRIDSVRIVPDPTCSPATPVPTATATPVATAAGIGRVDCGLLQNCNFADGGVAWDVNPGYPVPGTQHRHTVPYSRPRRRLRSGGR